MGASFGADNTLYVFSRRPPHTSLPAGVQFVTKSISALAERLRKQAGKNIWRMGGGEIIGSFLDENAIDEFITTLVPTFIGQGIPLIAPRRREVPLWLLSLQRFPDSVVHFITTCSNRESEASQTPDRRPHFRYKVLAQTC
jgi:dihydrofolate reductase